MLTAAKSADQNTRDTALALLRGSTAAAKAAAKAAASNDASQSGRGPAARVSLSPAAQAKALLQASLNALQPALDEDTSAALSDELEKTGDALTKLDQARSGMVADRKEAAEKKLEAARKKLALLRALGGDPKTIARQAKAIAQEIKAAAIEYGEALKAEGELGAAVAAPDAPADGDPPAEPGEASAGTTAAEAPAKDGETDATSPESTEPLSPADQAIANEKSAQHDREVLEAFKDAAREVRRMLEDAARKLRAQRDADADTALQAARSVDRAVEGLAEIVGTDQSVGASTITIPDAAVAISIDIHA